MASLVGLLIEVACMLFKLLLKVLFKLRILPAFLFAAITQIWFGTWAKSLGDLYFVIAIGLTAIGLGSFVVQGIIKLRSHFVSSKLEREYEVRQKQQLIDEFYRNGWITRINTLGNREEA